MSCITVCFTYSLRMAIFWTRECSDTFRVWWGVFIYDFVANFLLSLTLKEFWKLVNIWWSYWQEFGVLFFFDSQCRTTSGLKTCCWLGQISRNQTFGIHRAGFLQEGHTSWHATNSDKTVRAFSTEMRQITFKKSKKCICGEHFSIYHIFCLLKLCLFVYVLQQ